jgi:hypothetical protein
MLMHMVIVGLHGDVNGGVHVLVHVGVHGYVNVAYTALHN